MNKLFTYIFIFFIWFSTGWTNDNSDDLTDNQIKKNKSSMMKLLNSNK
ncbi:hypothetical protein OAH45_01930 [Candidatus Pelagibacter sp.]|nr:hypothetical protein [Candidatus Pelagibacter sp.]